jgi:TonB family protein
MSYGSQAFFEERARASRRVALLAAGIALAWLGVHSLWGVAWVREPVVQALEERFPEMVRWGYEGEERFVRRIILDTEPGAGRSDLRDVGNVVTLGTRRGGAPERAPGERGVPDPRPRLEGPGDALANLAARAVARRADVPIVSSEQLVIEHLVRPAYPEAAQAADITGRVAVLALVDTLGNVSEVEVVVRADPILDRAAAEAVRQCRFRPYRQAGRTSEVYALFRFNFTLY